MSRPVMQVLGLLCIGVSQVASGETQGALECLPKGRISAEPTKLTLPYYQPRFAVGDVDTIVQSAWPNEGLFTVLDGATGRFDTGPAGAVTKWRLGTYTGFPDVNSPLFATPLASFQRGRLDQFSCTGVQVLDDTVGLFLSTLDPNTITWNGSTAILTGCWFMVSNTARLFPTAAHSLDVSFELTVPTIDNPGSGHTQAYFQLIAVDRSGAKCLPVVDAASCDGGVTTPAPCSVWFSIGVYSPIASIATTYGVGADSTCTSTNVLAGGGIDATGYFTKMPDSDHYQTSAFSSPKLFHARLSKTQFESIIRTVKDAYPAQYGAMSNNAMDYEITLLNVNLEAYDPCWLSGGAGVCGYPSVTPNRTQSGVTLRHTRVTATIPHAAVGTPSGFVGNGPQVAFRTDTGGVSLFTWNAPTATYALEPLSTRASSGFDAVGDPFGFVSGYAPRVLFRDSAGNIMHFVYWGGQWSSWNMLGVPGAVKSVSSPKAFNDTNGMPHVLYRDSANAIHDLYLVNGSVWYHSNITTAAQATPATGDPMGFVSGSASRVVYRDVNGHVIQLVNWNGAWSKMDMLTVPGAVLAASPPFAFNDPSGLPHLVYRGTDGHVHDVYMRNLAWEHVDLTPAGAMPATNDPVGYVGGSAARVLYVGVDQHVYEIFNWAGVWVPVDLTATTPGALLATKASAFADTAGNPQVVYTGADNQLHRFHFASSRWFHTDL